MAGREYWIRIVAAWHSAHPARICFRERVVSTIYTVRLAMIKSMAQLHMTEAELARDLHSVLAKVQQGVEVVIEQDHLPVAIIRQPVHTPWAADFSHASCRLSLASDDKPGRIHIDPSQLSGILYLSKPEDCQGGTEFFRHKRTGTDRLPMTMEQLREAGFSSYEELQHDILDKDALDRSNSRSHRT